MTSENRLAKETSPYLLEHAHNPVQWYPWGEQALQTAKQSNKPILLSIGYAACHWCHVMARESFEDSATAELMNQWFINIKVDREERPDLDRIYQLAHQLLTGRAGGWPLTVFLTPDQQPFYAGTYFPPEESYGRPAFKKVMTEIAHFYYQRQDAIQTTTKAIANALKQITAVSTEAVVLTQQPLTIAADELAQTFDYIHGGFGHAPKFPLCHLLNFLLQNAFYEKNDQALHMVNHSLHRMAQGGFTDQLGGGFYRYCIDANWLIPHFEKMLYDNAQLIELYSVVSQIQKHVFLKTVAEQALQWVNREMLAPEGGFYSSINADSEQVEGKYYYWDRNEVRQVLSHLEYTAIDDYFGLNRPPNFEGHWHLYIAVQDQSVYRQWLEPAKAKLLAARKRRVHPATDKKILTGWNALMIKAFATAAVKNLFPNAEKIAAQAINFIYEHLWQDQRLLAVYSQGQSRLPAYLDDYVFLLDALSYFLQIEWSARIFNWIKTLAQQILDRFYDQENGGFFFTANDHEPLIQRLKIMEDEATPSGNGLAVVLLSRLGYWLTEPHYLATAEKTLQAAWVQMNQRPSAYTSLLTALREFFDPATVIILRAETAQPLTAWRQEFFKYYLPNHHCFAIPGSSTDLPGVFNKPMPASGVCAYICKGTTCREPVTSFEDFSSYLISAAN
ncbi:MAG: thioredoxin domain-containing protein [Proteobacteria bacterium]|nr:thioredoxin domain-containing protein [Pseudomonadota bacterium]